MDNRLGPRRRALKSARIVFNLRSCVFDCTVRNLSDHGALLIVGGQTGIPNAFELLIDGLPPRQCRVAWRKDERIGIEFVQDADGQAPAQAGVAGAKLGATVQG